MVECGAGSGHSSQTDKSPALLEIFMVKQQLQRQVYHKEVFSPPYFSISSSGGCKKILPATIANLQMMVPFGREAK